MPVETLSYQGINRAVSDYAGARSCEELINIRPTTEGLVPVKQFSTKFSNKDFEKVFVHHTTSGPKYIAVRKGTGRVLVQLLDPSGNPVTPSLFEVECSDQQAVIDNLSFAAAGNIILFSICADPVFENHAFTWKGTEYVAMEADDPGVTFTLSDEFATVTEEIPSIGKDTDKDEVTSIVENALNAAQEKNPGVCFGPVIIATALKTKDGSTFWTGNWNFYDPSPKIDVNSATYVSASDTSFYGHDYIPFIEAISGKTFVDGYTLFTSNPGTLERQSMTFAGTKVKLTFPTINDWDEETSIIQSVEVYCSRPQPYMDISDPWELYFGGPAPIIVALLLKKKYEDMDLGGQLLYHQASIPMASLRDGNQTVELSFGGNIQVTEDTLDVDAGAVRRYGKILSYNARFHYWDSVAKMDIGMPYFHQDAAGTGVSMDIFVRYEDSDESGLYYVGTETLIPTTRLEDVVTPIVIAPSINVKEVITLVANGSSSWKLERYRMQESSSYNYAIRVGGPNSIETAYQGSMVQDYLDAKARGKGVTNVEKAAINVTEQYNPFVFRVEHSYLAPGNVLDVKPQMAGIVDAAYGRDPLNVFTERGLYALTQGSANVLYGAFLPLSDLVVSGPSVATEMGIFFLADGALWLIAGRRATLVSDALHLGPHKFLRASTGYKKISGTDTAYSPDPAPANPVYDISSSLSQVPFDQYVKSGATLSFNRFRMELFVSNKAYTYTYVLSLKYRQWHKITTAVWQDEPGATIITAPSTTAGRINVLDMSVETDLATDVHLQTRPFSMGYQYSHVHRLLSMVRAEFGGATEHLTVALYGSDNLQDWKLLAYSHRSGKSEWNEERESLDDTPLKVSQIRTATSSRSWRYYAICLGGHIHTGYDIDFGPFLVDYEPVIRRIG